MLTDEALHERKWGRYPSLARLLSERPALPDGQDFRSVSDSLLSQITRLAEVAETAQQNAATIRAVTDAETALRLTEDLERLEGGLRSAGRFFDEHAELVGSLRYEVMAHEQRSRRQVATERTHPTGRLRSILAERMAEYLIEVQGLSALDVVHAMFQDRSENAPALSPWEQRDNWEGELECWLEWRVESREELEEFCSRVMSCKDKEDQLEAAFGILSGLV